MSLQIDFTLQRIFLRHRFGHDEAVNAYGHQTGGAAARRGLAFHAAKFRPHGAGLHRPRQMRDDARRQFRQTARDDHAAQAQHIQRARNRHRRRIQCLREPRFNSVFQNVRG